MWSHKVPEGVDILITHTPPRAHLDLLTFGCVHLLRELWRTRPKLHVVGHVHEARGIQRLQFDDLQEAYEDILLNNGGLYRLYRVVVSFLRTWCAPAKWSGCVLVNACAVGGWNNAQRTAEVVIDIEFCIYDNDFVVGRRRTMQQFCHWHTVAKPGKT